MKKFILAMFILSIISLQLPFYSLGETVPIMDIRVIIGLFTSELGSSIGNIIVYTLPFIGIIFAAIGVFAHKNTALLTAFISAIGIFYCGFIYFGITGASGAVNIGFILYILSYLLALTISVVSLRVKEQ